MICPRCLCGTASFEHTRNRTFISCPDCGTYPVLVADFIDLKDVFQAFQKERSDDLLLGSFMHRLEIALGIRDKHGDLTPLGNEIYG